METLPPCSLTYNLSLIAAFTGIGPSCNATVIERAHSKANQPRPHTAFKQVWGPMVVFDTKGKIMSLALPTKKQE